MENSKPTYYSHIPVLLEESVDWLVTDPSGIYVDATLGGGGHSEAILNALDDDGHLYSIDQDDDALRASNRRIGDDPRFSFIKGNFGYLSTLLPPQTPGQVTGVLFDLGVSTHQLKEGERGFSFQEDGPLDMRMGNLQRLTAHEVVNNYELRDLRHILRQYGEEKAAHKIAQAIIAARPLETTADLREAVTAVVPTPYEIKSLARVFQAIRIEVNQELEMLKQALEQALDVLKPGGRLVAISYHSLEDRIVKQFFKAGNHEGKVEKDFYGNVISPIKPLTRSIIRPSDEEIEENPAARSAKMRVAEKRDPEDTKPKPKP
jgi:16S rRNA (cytosine1402-N4)-methyltransferase